MFFNEIELPLYSNTLLYMQEKNQNNICLFNPNSDCENCTIREKIIYLRLFYKLLLIFSRVVLASGIML